MYNFVGYLRLKDMTIIAPFIILLLAVVSLLVWFLIYKYSTSVPVIAVIISMVVIGTTSIILMLKGLNDPYHTIKFKVNGKMLRVSAESLDLNKRIDIQDYEFKLLDREVFFENKENNEEDFVVKFISDKEAQRIYDELLDVSFIDK